MKAETPIINRYKKNIVSNSFQRTQKVETLGPALSSLEKNTEGSPGGTNIQREYPLKMLPGVDSGSFT